MPRRKRLYIPGLSVHIIHRGINRMTIFEDVIDHIVFLLMMRRAMDENDVHVHAFSLMKTHYHAIATPSRATALSAAMHVLGRRYTGYFNSKVNRISTLWDKRYVAKHIWDEKHWLTVLRYVELNPVRAGVVSAAEDYQWSSYRVHAFGEPSDWLVSHPAYEQLGATPLERQIAYRALCGVPLTPEELTEIRFARENCPRKSAIVPVTLAATPIG
jgi:putative transposase